MAAYTCSTLALTLHFLMILVTGSVESSHGSFPTSATSEKNITPLITSTNQDQDIPPLITSTNQDQDIPPLITSTNQDQDVPPLLSLADLIGLVQMHPTLFRRYKEAEDELTIYSPSFRSSGSLGRVTLSEVNKDSKLGYPSGFISPDEAINFDLVSPDHVSMSAPELRPSDESKSIADLVNQDSISSISRLEYGSLDETNSDSDEKKVSLKRRHETDDDVIVYRASYRTAPLNDVKSDFDSCNETAAPKNVALKSRSDYPLHAMFPELQHNRAQTSSLFRSPLALFRRSDVDLQAQETLERRSGNGKKGSGKGKKGKKKKKKPKKKKPKKKKKKKKQG